MLTIRQEKFCLHFAKGENGTQSVILAGFSPNGAAQTANNLLHKPEIQERLEQLKLKMQNNVLIDSDRQLIELERLKDISIECKNYKIAIECLKEQNKMLGLYAVEKKEIAVTGVQIITKDAEMTALVNGLIEEEATDTEVVV